MPEYVVTILSSYVVDAPNERDAGEAAYDLVTGVSIVGKFPATLSTRKRGDQIDFADGRVLRAFNAELAGEVEEVVTRSEAETMQQTSALLDELLDAEVPAFEIWTVKQESAVWWVRDHEGLPIVSDSERDAAIGMAEAIGEDTGRRFKIVTEKS